MLIHLAVCALGGKIRKILSGTKATGQQQRVKIVGLVVGQVVDLPPNDTRCLREHIAGLTGHVARSVIDDMHLRYVGCKTLHVGTLLLQSQKSHDDLLNLRAVVHSAPRQNHCYVA